MNKNELITRYKSLPQMTREVLASQEFVDACNNIGKKYNLSEENCSVLVNIIINRIVGMLDEKSTKEKIGLDLNIQEPDLSILYTDLNKNIINSIEKIHLESLKNIEANLKNVGVDFILDSYEPTKQTAQTMLDKNTEQILLEISTKYSLNKDQTQELIGQVSEYTSNNDSNITPESIATEIGVSKLVAEQVAQDIENRVFTPLNRAEKTISTDLPMLQKPILPSLEKVVSTNVPVYTPKPKVFINNEPVQTPISVPRFKAVPMDENEIVGSNFIPNLAPKPSTVGIMQAKMDKAPEVLATPNEKPSNYSVDPYREPLS